MGWDDYPETGKQSVRDEQAHRARERMAQLMAIVVPLIFAGVFVLLEMYHIYVDGMMQFETGTTLGTIASSYCLAFAKSFDSYFPSTVVTLALFPVIQQSIYKVSGGFCPTNLDILAIFVAIYALVYGAYIVRGNEEFPGSFILMGITVSLIVFVWYSLEEDVRHARRGWKTFAG